MKRCGSSLGLVMVLCTLSVLVSGPAGAEVRVEYVGHACFVLESPSGVRVVIDPFNGNRWLGYSFPESVAADAVLVSHPHYDHDASYYFGNAVPVFRKPGHYRVGDVEIQGIEGRHADPYGKDFDQVNTIWRVSTGGVVIAHLGDNGPPTAANIAALGRVDIVMLPADDQEHILKNAEIDALTEALDGPLIVPMHYRLDGFLDLPGSLGPIGPWLEGRAGVKRLASHSTSLGAAPYDAKVLLFRPAPELKPWSETLQKGWSNLDEARKLRESDPRGAAALVEESARMSDALVFAYQWARVLAESGSLEDAVQVLEPAVTRAERDDWQFRMQARDLLGQLYMKLGHAEQAHEQFRIVLQNSYRTELLERAREALASVR